MRLHLALDQVRNNLGVGLGDEGVALFDQLPLEVEVVLDDAVVHDDDAAGAVAMGVCVLFRRPAMRGPARVPDPVFTVERVDGEDVLEARQLARAATQLDVAVLDDCNTCRVVTAVLEPPQSVDEDWENFLAADVADDAAHMSVVSRQSSVVSRNFSLQLTLQHSTFSIQTFFFFHPALLTCRARAIASASAGHVLGN